METPPTISELERYYRRQYWGLTPEVPKKAVEAVNEYRRDPRSLHQIDLAMQMISPDHLETVLEIGAGSAYASLLLKKRIGRSSVQVYVCEPGQEWDAYYKNHQMEKIADYFPFPTAMKFDYVHTSHWLEHVPDLNDTLFRLREIVNPSGFVFVEVPNTEHDYWDLPLTDTPHIQFFSRDSLLKVFGKNGFKCLSIDEYGITFQEFNRGVKVLPERFGKCEKGFWIRSVFQKVG